MSPFRGHNQQGRSPQKGPVPQRELVRLLDALIDAAKVKYASATRDQARYELRRLMAEANWNTPYVLRNIGARRCRYLAGLGYDVPSEFSLRSDIERLDDWSESHG